MRKWISGLISAITGALASTITTMVVAPTEFNFETGTKKILIVATFSAIIALLNYLTKSPLPNKKDKSYQTS